MSKKRVVIGDGVLGTAAALHFIDCGRGDELTVISFRVPEAPSEDSSKIVRIDYPSQEPMKHAIRADERWRTDKRYKPYHSPVARIVLYDRKDIGALDSLDKTRVALRRPLRTRLGGDDVLGKYYGENRGKTRSGNDLICTYNEDDGLVNLKGCMHSLREYIKKRCTVIQKRVARLIYENRRIVSIAFDDGGRLDTSDMVVILAAGPWICQILSSSGINQPAGTPQAVGIFAFELELKETSTGDLPIVTHHGHAEFLPPEKGSRIAKITLVETFTHVNSTSNISHPEDLSKSFLAVRAMMRAKEWARLIIPNVVEGATMRIKPFWDGITETQNPVISRHPGHENLVICGGGSFNIAKFLPTIGEHILAVSDGKRVPQYDWENPSGLAQSHPQLLPRVDFRDLNKAAEGDEEVQQWILRWKQQAQKDATYEDVI